MELSISHLERPPKTCVNSLSPYACPKTESFKQAHTKERRFFFAAEGGPDPCGKTGAIEDPFLDPAQKLTGLREQRKRGTSIWALTQRTALFRFRMWPRPLWAHTSTRGSILRSGSNVLGLRYRNNYIYSYRQCCQYIKLLRNTCTQTCTCL